MPEMALTHYMVKNYLCTLAKSLAMGSTDLSLNMSSIVYFLYNLGKVFKFL